MNWKITNTKFNPQTGYIRSANYVCSAVDGEHSAQVTGDVFFTEPRDDEPSSFAVPFDDVTEENVLAWTKEHFGEANVKNIEDTVAADLVLKVTPIKANGLPWAAAQAPAAE
jgi:hypothetical protein